MYKDTGNEVREKKLPNMGNILSPMGDHPAYKPEIDRFFEYFNIPHDKREDFKLAFEYQMFHAHRIGIYEGRYQIQKGIRDLLDVEGKAD